MKYESEILYDLMKRDGLLNPSQDHLSYESELKEKYVNDVEGAYPKLIDYRAEWLNYNKCEYIPADFPTESQTNQTSGTFQNVVPFAYDVATLTGQTLVNVAIKESVIIANNWVQSASFIQPCSGKTVTFVNNSNKTARFQLSYLDDSWNKELQVPANTKTVYSLKDDEKLRQIQGNNNDGWELTSSGIEEFKKTTMIILGDVTNIKDIPYFEGMQSVKMPVLTTTGKNINDEVYESGYFSTTTGDENTWSDYQRTKNYIKVDGGNTLTFSRHPEMLGNTFCVFKFKRDKTLIDISYMKGLLNTLTITLPDDCAYIRIGVFGEFKEVQVELGKVSTPYEPYKSNILTVNEDVALRGIGNVKDELDCLTGKVTERIGESSELLASTMIESQELSNTKLFTIKLPNNMATSSNQYIICDKLPTIEPNAGGLWNTDVEGIAQFVVGNSIRLRLSKNKCTTLEEFQEWLNQNQITIQYKLTTDSIKTVDLSCINENNVECDFIPIMDTIHYETSSDTIKPLVDLTVCVEAITQNLASFVHLEGVEENE